MKKKRKDMSELHVPEGLEWHHFAFRKLGIDAHEYMVCSFAFPEPRKLKRGEQPTIRIQPDQRGLVTKKLSKHYGQPVRIPEDGRLPMPVMSMIAVLDDEYDTQVEPAMDLFMHIIPGKVYDFVVALHYNEERQRRWGEVLFLEPSTLSKKEWTDPGKRFSLKSMVMFYPSLNQQNRPQISGIHRFGKRIVVARNCPNPEVCEEVKVRLIEQRNRLVAIPVTPLMTEKEIAELEEKAISVDVNGKAELPPGHVWDSGEASPAWDSLNRQWALVHSKSEADIFKDDMPLSTFKKHYRVLLGKLSLDHLHNKHPAQIRARKERIQMVSHWLDVLEAFLENKGKKVKMSAKDNGEAKKPAKKAAKKATKKVAKKTTAKKASIKKSGKVTKPADA